LSSISSFPSNTLLHSTFSLNRTTHRSELIKQPPWNAKKQKKNHQQQQQQKQKTQRVQPETNQHPVEKPGFEPKLWLTNQNENNPPTLNLQVNQEKEPLSSGNPITVATFLLTLSKYQISPHGKASFYLLYLPQTWNDALAPFSDSVLVG
jgi:hypothetical protein